MRPVRYLVAMSLDGYIAGPRGEADWIIMDPEIDFGAIFDEFDTVLMGRETYDVMKQSPGMLGSMKTIVFSRSQPSGKQGTTVVANDPSEVVHELKREPGKDIWLMGGGELFRSLLELGLVDTVEVSVIPVLLGEGIPLLPATAKRNALELTGHKIYKTGIVSLQYQIRRHL